MVKLIAIDMDGTLVNNQFNISEENAEAIVAAQNQGIEVVIATGRSFKEAKNTLQEVNLKTPVICINGAQLRSSEGEVIHGIPIPKEKYQEVNEVLKQFSIYYELYTNKGTFTDNVEKAVDVIVDILVSANPEMAADEAHRLAEYRLKNGRITYMEDFHDLTNDNSTQIYKLLCFDTNNEKRLTALDRLNQLGGLAISASANDNLEVTNVNAQKGIALEEYAKARGISLEETMAVGDNYNDVSMLKRVGYSVAMGNAENDIKEIAKYTTYTNDQHGVAHAIQKFALEK